MAKEKPVEKRHASWNVVRCWVHLAKVFLLLLHCCLPLDHWHDYFILYAARIKFYYYTLSNSDANASRRAIHISSFRHHHGEYGFYPRPRRCSILHSLRHPGVISEPDLLEYPAVLPLYVSHPRGASPRLRCPPRLPQLHSRIQTIAWMSAML